MQSDRADGGTDVRDERRHGGQIEVNGEWPDSLSVIDPSSAGHREWRGTDPHLVDDQPFLEDIDCCRRL